MTKQEVMQLRLDTVKPNPYQPRKIFDPMGLSELAESIKTHGVLQPITVRLINNQSYELVAGERRLRASKLARLETIPAILVSISDLESALLAIIENLQRQNLHFFEEAEGFKNLMSDYSFTQEALAIKIGKNQSTIANKLRLLKLPKEIQKSIISNDLTERHARALLRLDDENLQQEVIQKIITQGLTVRKTEDIIDIMLTPPPKGNTIPFKAYIRDIRILKNSILENLEIVRRGGLDTHFDMQETDTGYNINIVVNYGKEKLRVVS